MLMGGGLYFLIELIFRGYSHWTMFILGGLCFVVCGIVNDISKGRLAIWQEMVWCMIIIRHDIMVRQAKGRKIMEYGVLKRII